MNVVYIQQTLVAGCIVHVLYVLENSNKVSTPKDVVADVGLPYKYIHNVYIQPEAI